MEKVWISAIIISFVFAVCTGRVEIVTKALFDSTNTAINLCLNIAGVICMWSGFMKIAEKSGFINVISSVIRPVTKLLFPRLEKNSQASGHIAMNMAANILGMGNVATPLGIRAMEKLQEITSEKEKVSDEMLMLIVLNTASIQLFPTSVIALRISAGSENPNSIIIPTILSSVISVMFGIILVKMSCKREKK